MQSRRSQYRRLRRKAFTLVEVMIVLFILMILASIGVVALNGAMERARIREAAIFVNSMKTPLDLYKIDHGRYPVSLESLLSPDDTVDSSKGAWPYVENTAVKADPWQSPYQYAFPGQRNTGGYDLWSLGPDGISDTDDDIGNW